MSCLQSRGHTPHPCLDTLYLGVKASERQQYRRVACPHTWSAEAARQSRSGTYPPRSKSDMDLS